MSVIVVGVNHHTSPLPVLERLTLTEAAAGKAVHGLVQRDNVREAVVLATCSRTEIYLVGERFHGAFADATDLLADVSGMSVNELHPYLYVEHDEAAVRHLFEVASGLDSVVLGEGEILGQVRRAAAVAREHGGLRSTMQLLFDRALAAGKRARTDTGIARGTTSISHAAVEMAAQALGSLDGRDVLVVGAGEMGRGVATALRAAGVREIVVANRTPSRGAALAATVDGRVSDLAGLPGALDAASVVVTCSDGATMLDVDLVAARAAVGPLLIVDIAVPRNVDPAVAALHGVTLFDLDDLARWTEAGRLQRQAVADRVGEIVADEVGRYLLDVTARQAAPLVAQLHERAESIRNDEIARYGKRLETLGERERESVDALTKAIVAKLLHGPTVRLRAEVGTPQGERNAAAVRELFDLEP